MWPHVSLSKQRLIFLFRVQNRSETMSIITTVWIFICYILPLFRYSSKYNRYDNCKAVLADMDLGAQIQVCQIIPHLHLA